MREVCEERVVERLALVGGRELCEPRAPQEVGAFEVHPTARLDGDEDGGGREWEGRRGGGRGFVTGQSRHERVVDPHRAAGGRVMREAKDVVQWGELHRIGDIEAREEERELVR